MFIRSCLTVFTFFCIFILAAWPQHALMGAPNTIDSIKSTVPTTPLARKPPTHRPPRLRPARHNAHAHHAATYVSQHDAKAPRRAEYRGPAPRPLLSQLTVGRDGKSTCTTIREALLRARPGAVIKVRPGSYYESIEINRAITIAGDGDLNQIVVSSSQPCILMLTAKATVRGLTLRTTFSPYGGSHYAVAVPTGTLRLFNCDIQSDGLASVSVHGQQSVAILSQCSIHDSKASGVFAFDGGSASLSNCLITNNGENGVTALTAARVTLQNCTLERNRRCGLNIFDKCTAVIEDCDVTASEGIGILIGDGGSLTAKRCQVYNGKQQGMVLTGSSRASLDHCKFSGNALTSVSKSEESILQLENSETP